MKHAVPFCLLLLLISGCGDPSPDIESEGEKPKIVKGPKGGNVAVGATYEFIVEASGTPPLTYKWYRNGAQREVGDPIYTETKLETKSVSVYVLHKAKKEHAGKYFVVVSNKVGESDQSEAQLKVFIKPSIDTPPTSTNVVEGAKHEFRVEAKGDELKYQWSKDGVPVNKWSEESTLILEKVTAESAGGYSVRMTNEVGEATSDLAQLKVLIKPTIKIQPGKGEVVEGGKYEFKVKAEGTPPFEYRWYRNRNLLNEWNKESTLILEDVTEEDAGEYLVQVKNKTEKIEKDQAELKVLVPPKVTTEPSVIKALVGEDVTFTITAKGTPPLTYRWFKDGVPRTDWSKESSKESTLKLGEVEPGDAGDYWVTVRNEVEDKRKTIRLDVLTAAAQKDERIFILGVSVVLTLIIGVVFLKWFRRGSKTTQIKVSEGIPVQPRDGSDRVDRDVKISTNLLLKQCKFCGEQQDVGFEGACPKCSQWVYVCSRHKAILFLEPVCPLCVKDAVEQFKLPIKVPMEEVSEIWNARISETLNVIGESGIVEEQETTEAPYSEQGEEKDESIVKESRSGWWDKIKRLIGFGPPKVNKKDESKTIEPITEFTRLNL